jgi:hypothetical protein
MSEFIFYTALTIALFCASMAKLPSPKTPTQLMSQANRQYNVCMDDCRRDCMSNKFNTEQEGE